MTHTEGVAPASTDLVPPSPPTIIDVEKSFRKAIAGYTLLEQAASSLKKDITALPPQQILLRSTQLSTMQQDLTRDDEQLIAILSLAGREIVHEKFIKDYQEILAQVILSCDQIRAQASLVRKKLSEQIDNTQNS